MAVIDGQVVREKSGSDNVGRWVLPELIIGETYFSRFYSNFWTRKTALFHAFHI